MRLWFPCWYFSSAEWFDSRILIYFFGISFLSSYVNRIVTVVFLEYFIQHNLVFSEIKYIVEYAAQQEEYLPSMCKTLNLLGKLSEKNNKMFETPTALLYCKIFFFVFVDIWSHHETQIGHKILMHLPPPLE